MHRLPVFLAAIALTVTTPALAQQQGQDIVVTGERDSRTKEEAVRVLTRTISKRSDGQVARFSDPVCAASVGFDTRYNEMVVDRINEAARGAGVAVDKPGCRANLTVIMVDSGQRTLQALYKVKPQLFGIVPIAERKRLLADGGPVHVVTFTELRDRDGERLRQRPDGAASGLGAVPTLLVHSASIINPATRQDISGSVVLIDRDAALGKTLRQLADYAAMRALARTHDAEPGDNTILTLFAKDGASPPSELTSFDRAYLKTLYKGPATRSYYSKVADMARGINDTGATASEPAP